MDVGPPSLQEPQPPSWRAHAVAFARRHLPDPQDARYPRPGWFAALREVVGGWWILLSIALALGLTRLISRLVAQAARGVGALWNRDALAQALWSAFLLDRLSAALVQRLWLLAPALLALLVVFLGARWAIEDRERETLIVALRLLRVRDPQGVARDAGGILYRWARRRGLLVGLLLVAVATGVALGLLWIS
jgi:hypothetical protein